MKQQPDNIFQQKLAEYRRPAPAAAWDRIERTLDNKSNGFAWKKIAASVIILALAGGAVFLMLQTETKQQISQVERATNAKEQNTAPKEKKDIVTVDIDNKTETIGHETPERRKPTEKKLTRSTTKDTNLVNAVDSLLLPLEISGVTTEEHITQVTTTQNSSSEELLEEAAQPTVTLVISADETTSYYQKEKNITEVEATTKDKKSSTFQKLLRKASDLKTNQDPFGELRQKKNEILALNFKNEKKRTQKNN